MMAFNRNRSRTDATGRAYAGSQRQIQTYVNERADELSRAVVAALHEYAVDPCLLRWISPLKERQYREYRDKEFLEQIGAAHLAAELKKFWPVRGPRWDALASVANWGCVLVEAKSHVPEVYGSGCCALGDSLSVITSSLSKTKTRLGVPPDADWLGPLYQSANRIAHLLFLREIGNLNAFLLNIYFTDDPHSPTAVNEWNYAIQRVNEQLGLTKIVPYSAHTFLKAVSPCACHANPM